MSQKITDLKQKRAGLVAQMRTILDKASDAKRELTAEENTSYNQLETDLNLSNSELKRHEVLAESEAAVKASREQRSERRGGNSISSRVKGNRPNSSEEYFNAFFGADGFIRAQGAMSAIGAAVTNVLKTSVDGDGGFLVPEEFEAEIIRILYNADPIRAAATVLTSGSDRNIPVQASGITFGWLGELGTYPKVTPGIGRVILRAHKLGGAVPISEELIQDSGSDIVGFIRDVGVQAMADLQNEAFTVGDGAHKPLGIFATSLVGGVAVGENTGAVSASAAITGDDLINTFHSLGRQYRARSTWLTTDTMVKMIRKLKDSTGQYIWQPGLVAGQPDAILGRPVAVSDFAPAPVAGGRSIALGDMKKYWIADRLGLGMRRLDELGALEGQIYFRMNARVDASIVDAKAFTFFKHGAAS